MRAMTVTVDPADLAKCREFYVEVLGCSVLAASRQGIELGWPGEWPAAGRLRFRAADRPAGGASPAGGPAVRDVSIAVQVSDVDLAYAAARERGHAVVESVHDRDGARRFTVTDPVGLELEVCSPRHGAPPGPAAGSADAPPPPVSAWELLAGRTDLRWPYAVRAAATLRLADHIASGATRVDELAARTGTDPAALGRLLRYLSCRGVFAAAGPERFELTELAGHLRDAHPSRLRAWLDLEGAGGRMDQAFAGLLDVVRTGEPAYPGQFGQAFWADLGSSADLSASFDFLMATHAERFAAEVVRSCDWTAVTRAVDVGGGTGGLLAEVLRSHPHVSGVLVDQESPAAAARQRFRDENLGDRSRVVVQSFFDPLPGGASVYLLSRILHDWNDHDAVTILRNCAAAGGPRARVLVVEAAPPGDADLERLTAMDLRMLVVYGGRERTTDEISRLAGRAGLAVRSVARTPSDLAVIDLRRPGG